MKAKPSIRVSPDVVAQDVGDGLVLLNLRTGIYWGLNRTGAVIWRGIENRTRIEAICRKLQGEFDGPEDELAVAVQVLLSELAAERLIVEGTQDQNVPGGADADSPRQKRSKAAKNAGRKPGRTHGKMK